jgi:1-acyl-sn-glycerol-3-phosphate acyltransferase
VPGAARFSALLSYFQAEESMDKLRLYLRLTRLAAVLGVGALLATFLVPVERLTRRDLLGLRQRLTRWFLARLGNALPFRVSVQGRIPQKPMLWLSNHISWTDIPLIGRLAPLSFLSKAEVRTWPVAGWLAAKAGSLFIRRGSGDSQLIRKQMTRHLQSAHPLLMFPEGTTTDGRSLRTFHGRLLSAAIDSEVMLQPVAIRYLRNGEIDALAPFIGEDDLLSHLMRLFSNDCGDVEVHLLKPIPCQGRERAALAFDAQQAVQKALFGDVARPAEPRRAGELIAA